MQNRWQTTPGDCFKSCGTGIFCGTGVSPVDVPAGRRRHRSILKQCFRPAAVPIFLATLSLIAFITGACHGLGSSVRDRSPRVLHDPLIISADTTLGPADLHCPHPTDAGALVIETDDVTLDLAGVTLCGAASETPPDACVGRGIVVRNARNVTIRNAIVRGFKVGIYAENATNLIVEACDVSNNYRQRLKSTPQRENLDDWLYPHENDDNEWLRYGAGIYLLRCDGARAIRNRARDGQNGLCVVRSNGVIVEANDMSFLSGWGLAMYRSSRCAVVGNRFDYCVRGYSHGAYDRGQDSTGILVFEQSNDNLFADNLARFGGDGFFLFAGNETLNETGQGGCNRNVVYNNDFSHAVANGIEATFSEKNLFIHNKLNDCIHGIWAGYSRASVIAGNEIADCDNGVSIEHGADNRIEHNAIRNCKRGVRLWWDEDPHMADTPYCRQHGCRCTGEHIAANRFSGCDTAIALRDAHDPVIEDNVVRRSARVLHLDGGTSGARFNGNTIAGGRITNDTGHRLDARGNIITADVTTAGPMIMNKRRRPPDASSLQPDAPARLERCLRLLADSDLPAAAWAREIALRNDNRLPDDPLAQRFTAPRSKREIIIGEWGPLNWEHPRQPSQFRMYTAGYRAFLELIGVDRPFKVQPRSGNVVVTPVHGTMPALVEIRPRGDAHGYVPFNVDIKTSVSVYRFNGGLIHATWQIAYYTWTDDTDPRDSLDNWQRIIAGEPFHQQTANGIDFTWGASGPTQTGPRDHFALVATTAIDLPAGRWRFRTISDDGIRVSLNGERIIDNWTWHGPTEDVADVDLSAGRHTIRVEYFEIDGHAQLQLAIEPAD